MKFLFLIKTKKKKLRIIFFLFIASFLLLLKNIYNNKTYFIEGKFDSYDVAFNKAKEFINNNIKGILMNTEKVKISKNPNISIVIPCYNCKKYILRALRSIQNQNFSNFEIVISNDGSTKDTLDFIEQLQKEENRIRIINNKINMGLLHSRCIGSLAAKGKYILPMDSDDMFLDNDVFSILTNSISKGNFDIIIYNSIYTSLKPDVYTTKFAPTIFDNNHIPNRILFQPDLGYYHITPSKNLEQMNFNDELIHGKFFKSKIYKNAVNKLGKERYSRYMISLEDDLINNIIFNIAKSAKFISKYGYLFINNEDSYSKKQKDPVQFVRNYLYILEALIDFTLNLPRNKRILVNFIIYLFKNHYLKDLLNTEYDNKLFISCLDRILNCKYISDKHKNEIKSRGKMLNFIKYNF